MTDQDFTDKLTSIRSCILILKLARMDNAIIKSELKELSADHDDDIKVRERNIAEINTGINLLRSAEKSIRNDFFKERFQA